MTSRRNMRICDIFKIFNSNKSYRVCNMFSLQHSRINESFICLLTRHSYPKAHFLVELSWNGLSPPILSPRHFQGCQFEKWAPLLSSPEPIKKMDENWSHLWSRLIKWLEVTCFWICLFDLQFCAYPLFLRVRRFCLIRDTASFGIPWSFRFRSRTLNLSKLWSSKLGCNERLLESW